MYTAHILRGTGNSRIPQADWDNVRVFLPKGQKRQIIRKNAFDVSNSYKQWRIYPEQLAQAAPKSVMLFRPSMMSDMEQAGCVEGSRLTFSMWRGYWHQEETKPLREWLQHRQIPMDYCHTSGHASLADLIRMRGAFPDATIVPIHTSHPSRFGELFSHAACQVDGAYWDVTD
jgi:ribonuclease J